MQTPPSEQSPVGDGAEPAAQRIDVPLRFRALARKDPTAAQRAVELDRALQTAARRAAAASPRSKPRLLREMMELRVQLDAFVATVMGDPLPTGAEPSALAQVPPHVRAQLARLLGVDAGVEFIPLLERKAAEWIEHGRAFDEIAAEFGFVEASTLAPREPRGALALTHNGSLLQVSAPKDDGTRRFVYQSLYVNTVPSEGALTMGEAARVDHRLRSSAMDTSAIRKLRVAARARGDWTEERRTFTRISSVLSMPPREPQRAARPTSWGNVSHGSQALLGSGSGSPILSASRLGSRNAELAHVEEAMHRARKELATIVEQLAFERVKRHTLDVELLGLVLHLQELAVERGATPHAIGDVARVITDRREALLFGEELVLERPGKPSSTHGKSALGEQRIVVGAPLMILDAAGEIAALLGDVASVETR